MKLETSADLYNRALKSIPAGTHSNSRAAKPHPRYYTRAQGDRLWDTDGNEWLDFTMGNAAIVLGHGNEPVIEAITRALQQGIGAGVETELSILAAERFLDLVPTAEQVRFTNTGTEAAMHAVHLARVITGRPHIAKVEASYHGWWDELFVSTWPDTHRAGPPNAPQPLPGGAGLREDAVQSAVIIPFNNLEASTSILRANKDRIAALLIEPVLIDIGYIPPVAGYLEGLREVTRELGILLIFDELLTGLRLGPAGAQGRFHITPDLSIWSKALANGFPIAALAGRREYMERTAPGSGNAPFIGTFNGFRPGLAACLATLEQLADGEIASKLEDRSKKLAQEFDAIAQEVGVSARLHAGGGHLHPYFTHLAVKDYRTAATTDADAYATWHKELANRGMIVAGGALLHSAFSAAHSEASLERFLEASRGALQEIGRTLHA